MLHILFLILKIICIVIATILGILIICAFAVIMAPLVYKLDFSCKENPENIRFCITWDWIAKLISGEICYENKKMTWKFRAAWKQFHNDSGKKEENKNSPETGKKVEKQIKRANPNQEPDSILPDSGLSGNTESPPFSSREKKEKQKTEKTRVLKKITYKFDKICANMKSLAKTKDRIRDFLTDKTHHNACKRIIHELRRFFRFLKPTEAQADILFGCSDPSHTGYILAALSLIYPSVGTWMQITPDFEQRILQGNCIICGKIKILHVLIPAWNIFWDKNVRKTYTHIKHWKQK